MQRAGRVWICPEATPPPLVDGELTDPWVLLGVIADHGQDAVRRELRRARKGASGKAVEFYVLATPDVDVDALPPRVWVGVDPVGHDDDVRLVSAAPARVGEGLHRPPEAHPGLVGPQRFVGLRVSTTGRVSFRRAE